MNREEAVEYVWMLSDGVAGDVCRSGEERDVFRMETLEALRALTGIHPRWISRLDHPRCVDRTAEDPT